MSELDISTKKKTRLAFRFQDICGVDFLRGKRDRSSSIRPFLRRHQSNGIWGRFQQWQGKEILGENSTDPRYMGQRGRGCQSSLLSGMDGTMGIWNRIPLNHFLWNLWTLSHANGFTLRCRYHLLKLLFTGLAMFACNRLWGLIPMGLPTVTYCGRADGNHCVNHCEISNWLNCCVLSVMRPQRIVYAWSSDDRSLGIG